MQLHSPREISSSHALAAESSSPPPPCSTAISKVTTGIGQAISGSSSPTKSNKPTTSTPRSSPLTGSFSSSNPIANLVGRAVGGLVAGVVDQLGKQLESAAQESQRAYSSASAAIKRSSKVQRVLGGAVECGQIASQSMSSTNINGASSSSIDLSFQVFSASGKVALARVSSDGNKRMDIKLFLQDGTTVDVGASDEGSGGAIGGLVSEEIIEAEFKDLLPKK